MEVNTVKISPPVITSLKQAYIQEQPHNGIQFHVRVKGVPLLLTTKPSKVEKKEKKEYLELLTFKIRTNVSSTK